MIMNERQGSINLKALPRGINDTAVAPLLIVKGHCLCKSLSRAETCLEITYEFVIFVPLAKYVSGQFW